MAGAWDGSSAEDMPDIPAREAKAALRTVFLRRRAALPERERRLKSASAGALVLGLPAYRSARCLLAYRPLGAELDPGVVVEHAVACGKAVYYPRVVDTALEFEAASPGRERREREALAGAALSSPSLVLVPGLAFDCRGVRLGRGGGHYDRALDRLPGVLRVGLAFDEQVVPELPREPWDILMDCVVTESRVLRTGRGDAGA